MALHKLGLVIDKQVRMSEYQCHRKTLDENLFH